MDRDEAERLLDALADREKEAQQRRFSGGGGGGGNDW